MNNIKRIEFIMVKDYMMCVFEQEAYEMSKKVIAKSIVNVRYRTLFLTLFLYLCIRTKARNSIRHL